MTRDFKLYKFYWHGNAFTFGSWSMAGVGEIIQHQIHSYHPILLLFQVYSDFQWEIGNFVTN